MVIMIRMIRMIWVILFSTLIFGSGASYAEMYKWVDEKGKLNFSDKKPVGRVSSQAVLKPGNIIEGTSTDFSKTVIFKEDRFRLPFRSSSVPYRFILTSSMNGDEPVDRLSSINISMKQKTFSSYVKLTGIESNKNYRFRIRIIDAKGELVFDKDKLLKPQTNSAWFVANMSPRVGIDEPGLWTIQGVLNNEKLFVEKRNILF